MLGLCITFELENASGDSERLNRITAIGRGRWVEVGIHYAVFEPG